MVATSDWLIGSYPDLESQSMTVTTAGPVAEACVLAAGDYYLYDDLSDWDLINELQIALLTHSVLNDVGIIFQENRRIRIVSTIAFALTWPTDNILRNLLGFTGNLTSALEHTAANVSPLLWSPGKNNNPTEARKGTDGIKVMDVVVGQSGPGTMRATKKNEYRRNTLLYRHIANARVWTTAEAGGEFCSFFDNVLVMRRRFKVWPDVPEGTGTTSIGSPADTGGPIPSSGAYVYNGPNEMPWGREHGYKEFTHPITLPVNTTREYDAP